MAFMAIILGLTLLFYIRLGLRYYAKAARTVWAFWGKLWALGAKVWDPILKVQEPWAYW